MSRSVIVIGGGFAGLSAATALAEKGFDVTVLEGRQVLGGRAYSFKDPKTDDFVDNGQHLFMGCYDETLAFLQRIGTDHRLEFQENLSVDFMGDGGRRASLRCWPLPAPWHLLSGLFRLSTLSWGDRFRLRYVERAIREGLKHPEALDQITVENWLIKARQSEQARRHFWDLIAIAALNEDPSIASAASFVSVLAQAFFGRRNGSRLGLSKVGLSDLYVAASRQFVEVRGGRVSLKAPVAHLECVRDRVTSVVLRDSQRLKADWVISAVPPAVFVKLLPARIIEREPIFQRVTQLKYAPIISIHLWFDREISRSTFAGLLDTHIQWYFNRSRILPGTQTREGYISLVISGAHPFVEWNEKKLLTMALEELRRLMPMAREAVLLRSLVIKEHQATLSPTVGSEQLRPSHRSPIGRLLIAGDWTRTGLPATIESACLSGHRCAEIILQETTGHASEPKEVAYGFDSLALAHHGSNPMVSE